MDMRALLEPKKGKQARQNKVDEKKTKNSGDNGNIKSSSPSATTPTTPSRSTFRSTTSTNTSPTTGRVFDPRALLNPRGNRSSVKVAPMDNTEESASSRIDLTTDSDNAMSGKASGFRLMNQVHNTQKRVAERPAKKQKTEHEYGDEVGKPKKHHSSSRHGNAGVGTYFQLPQQENPETTIPASIDLTGDDGDDDVEITEVRNIDDQEVCYGMIGGIINAHKVPKPPKPNTLANALEQWPIFKIELVRNQAGGQLAIDCTDPNGVKFGRAREELAAALAPAMDVFPRMRLQARVLARPKRKNEEVYQPCSDNLKITINVYGRRGDAEKLGRWFGQKNLWFATPMVSDLGVPQLNPHQKQRAPFPQTSAGPRSTVTFTRTVEEAATAVSKLFDYQAKEGNTLPETEASSNVLTQLLPHQKQALTFMLKQEQPRTYDTADEAGNSSLWRQMYDSRGQLAYEEVVTGIQQAEAPPESPGGLLADVMGLGKTIQALALISTTAEKSRMFQDSPVEHKGEADRLVEFNSRATLIVAPVSTVKNWEDQMREHINPGTMAHYVYHGSSRTKDAEFLSNFDVIITTYGTIAYEMKSNEISPLLRIKFFRIVLDEAHTIRESKSIQAKAMFALHATRRWCLTGTPIQNRMEDLGSLTTFLRLYPYDSLARFKQHVQAPAQSGDPDFLKRLRVFVDSFTLRRLRDTIDLPKHEDLTVGLEFAPAERRLHDFFREKFAVAIKEMSKQQNQHKAIGAQYHRVLKGITILRLICDHGKELLKPAELDEFKGSQPEDAIDIDAEPVQKTMTTQEAYEAFNLFAQVEADNCALCAQKLSGDSLGSPGGDNGSSADTLGCILPCKDVFCVDCFEQFRSTIQASKMQNFPLCCVICGTTIPPDYVRIPVTYNDELQKMVDSASNANLAFKNGTYEGPHTKTKALLSDLADICTESRDLEEAGEPPIKAVVFSEFTSHLDLIEKALCDNGWANKYTRIDGSMSLPARRKVLDALNTDNNTTILLASIKAAGQGLNLTAASRAFIMEPMWNPAAEEQAVDRIYRIGQKRAVVVRRYRMQDSIEQKIEKLQHRKKKLAEMSMEKASMQKLLSKKERNENQMKAMLDIFKG